MSDFDLAGEAFDLIEIEILENGTAKITTPSISDANHAVADELVKKLKTLLGGEVTVERRPDHEHQEHVHQHHGHTHRKLGA